MASDAAALNVHLDPAGRIAQDIHCIHCGYNLRSLLSDQACPECGKPVEPSLRGDLLCFSSPVWLAKLAWGSAWLILGWVMEIVSVFALQPLLRHLSTAGTISIASWGFVLGTFDYTMQAVQLIGIWMATSPDPRTLGNSSPLDARVLARILPVANCIRRFLPWSAVVGLASSTMLWLTWATIWLLGWICLYVHLARVARRIPSIGLVWLTYAGVAAITVGSCVNDAWVIWNTCDRVAGRVSYVPFWASVLINWGLPLAYMVLLLAAQILYRMQFRRALR